MFPKAHRFTTHNFEFLRKKMGSFRAGGFLFLYRKATPARYAVVVSKKVEPKAVKRNQFRRRTYDLLREELSDLNGSFQLICLYKGDQLPKNSAEIKPAILTLKAHLNTK